MSRTMKLMVIIAALLVGASAVGGDVLDTETLTGVRQINRDGFGGDANKYSFSMAAFGDALYVGTLNLKNMGGMFNFFAGLPAKYVTEGAEVWRYDRSGEWTRVVEGGLGDRANIGVRKMAAIGKCLYGVTANHNSGMEVWRTCDGYDWEVVVDDGFGEPKNTSGRGLGWFDGYIYVGVENRSDGAQLWRSRDGDDWEKAADQGLGDPANVWVSDFAEFNGRLYMGTLNITGGMELFSTRDGRHFERHMTGGGDKRTNMAGMKLITFNGRLLVSTMDFFNGFDLYSSEDGVDFSRIMANGYNDDHNAYLWQMEVYNGRLYAGTYYHKLPWPNGAFHLYSSADGEDWVVEDVTGFGNPFHYGVRSMSVYDGNLIVGTASPRYGTKVFAASAKAPLGPGRGGVPVDGVAPAVGVTLFPK